MARTHSSYTASPTRRRSPQRSPARGPTSEDGSQYEMDLDALGLNSTFESTEIDEKHQPKVDVVDTSDIEGPEDFTMNMTYWMTADLPLAQQIRSRKEAHVGITEVRGDFALESGEMQDTTGEGDKAVIEESSRDREVDAEQHTASAATVANETINEVSKNKAPSESSMENEEKVRSYLSALPDTDIGEDVLTSTPLRVPKSNMLQVPSPGATKARSLQATVEDYDTPRKPTLETVIHHPPEHAIGTEQEELQRQVAELQSRLKQQEMASTSRITELETLLSYTRSDLETARTEGYKQKEQIHTLKQDNQRQRQDVEATRASVQGQLQAQEKELNARIEEFGEEMRLQNLAKLQNQRADFERQLRALEQAKRAVDDDMEARGQLLEQVKSELTQLRSMHKRELEDLKAITLAEGHRGDKDSLQERIELQQRLSSVQSRADTFQSELEKATAEAKSVREANAALNSSMETTNRAQQSLVSGLESRLTSLQTQLDAAQANIAIKDEQLQRNSDLESRLKLLQSKLEVSRVDSATNSEEFQSTRRLESRLQLLQDQLDSARSDAVAKDRQLLQAIEEQERYEQRSNAAQGRVESLENTVSTLRQQLAEAHRDSAKARTDAEQHLNNLESATDGLQDARMEADRRVADIEKKLTKMKELKLEAESKFKELQSQHDELIENHEANLEGVREKAEDAVRKAGSLLAQERIEKKRVAKELKKTSHELQEFRVQAAQRTAEADASDEESSLLSSSQADSKDTEIENLRTLLRTQFATLKTIKSETTSLRKENKRLKTEVDSPSSETLAELQGELFSLRRANENLKAEAEAREADFEAVNKAMDERLASMLSKVLKERARTAVGKRDGQWAESMARASEEKELMGRVLLREWGRQEMGVAQEGEKQRYRYKYVSRT